MQPSVIIREYNQQTGEFIRMGSSFDFGDILSGNSGDVKAFDIVINEVSNISNLQIELRNSSGIEVSPSDAVITNNISNKGNFGIDNSSIFEVKNSLNKFFGSLNSPVSIPMRSSSTSNFIYMNMTPGNFTLTNGSITYGLKFDCSPYASSSSSSSGSHSSSSNSSSSHSSSCSSCSCSSSSSSTP